MGIIYDSHGEGQVDELEVKLVVDGDSLRVVSTAKASAAGRTASGSNTGGSLTYELRDEDGALLHSGQVADPRTVRVEWLEQNSYRGHDTRQLVGGLSVRLPHVSGYLTLLEQTPGGPQQLGEVWVDASGNTVMRGLLDMSDVLGPPVKVTTATTPGLNVLILPEGYTEAEMPKFHDDVQRIVDNLSQLGDFADHWDQIHIYRQDVRSAQSGVDDPNIGVVVDTAFDLGREMAPSRLLWFDNSFALAAVQLLGAGANANAVVVVANISEWAGAGGQVATVTAHPDAALIFAHELGHSVLKLADEYDYGPPNCDTSRTAPNVSSSPWLQDLPWKDLVTTSELPTSGTQTEAVGAFEGAAYCATGMYRAQHNCRMRQSNVPFCAVCRREMDAYFASFGGTPNNCPPELAGDGVCDECLGNDPDCVGCGASDFTCNDGSCIPGSWVCNQFPECPGGEDEAGCPPQGGCDPGQLSCDNGTRCVDNALICDGVWHCANGDDESIVLCDEPTGPCASDEFQCNDGTCINGAFRCDGSILDCSQGEDESVAECGGGGGCAAFEWQCPGGMCILASEVCDGVWNCPAGEDESPGQCSTTGCASDEFECNYGACVPNYVVCNGIDDCSYGEDEYACD